MDVPSTSARSRHRVMRSLVLSVLTLGALGMSGLGSSVEADTATVPLQGEAVRWISVSPDYAKTGLVFAMGTDWQQGCSSECNRLWLSHDGGAAWQQVNARGWEQGQPTIAQDAGGHIALFAQGHTALQRSDDLGVTWQNIGTPGTATPAPTFADDGVIAVAGTQDYVLKHSQATPVKGSGGQFLDTSFMFSPNYPSGGSHAPVLLSTIDRNAQAPIIQQCDAQLTCTGAVTLAGTSRYALPVTLLPSRAYASDGIVFAQSQQGVYKSTDGGKTFVVLNVGPPPATGPPGTPQMVLAPGYQESGPVRTAFVAVIGTTGDSKNPQPAGGVYRTDDGGSTWSRVGSPSPLDFGATAVAVAPDGRLFGAYLHTKDSGVMCMPTGGRTWQNACPPTDSHSAASPGVAVGGNTTGACPHCAGSTTPGAAGQQVGAAPAAPTPSRSRDGGAGLAATGDPGSGPRGGVPVLPIVGVAAVLLGGVVVGVMRRRATPR